MNIYDKLERLGLRLPSPPPSVGLFLPVKQAGNLLYTSGQGPIAEGAPVFTGKVGRELTVEQGAQAARICILNVLAILHAHLGDLELVKNIVKVLAFVASAPGFGDQPKVANGGSQLLMDLFDHRGHHARSAIGTSELPGNIPVEIEVICEI